jgi:trimeric autotransporter adhesin
MRKVILLVTMLFAVHALAVTALDPKAINSSFKQTIIGKVNELTAATAGGVLTNGKILVGNGSSVATAVTPSGGVTMTNAGVFTIADAATTVEGNYAKKIARFVFDQAVDGATIGAHLTGVSLPAKAIITNSWFYTKTQFADTGSGTVAISCEDANNIFTATDITGNAAGTIVAGASDGGAAATFVGGIAAACEITVTVAGADQSAGALVGFVEYVVVN